MSHSAQLSSGLDLDVLARVGAALGDGTRRAILATLVDGPEYPGELANRLGATRPSISNHLACLRGCGLVTATYEGRRVRYALAHQAIGAALVVLSELPLGPCPLDDTATSPNATSSVAGSSSVGSP